MFRNLKRFKAFKNRVVRSLPSRHPDSGGRLSWDIRLKYKRQFDPMTGKTNQVGLAKLSIIQNAPTSIVKDTNVYYFDWFNKDIKKSRFFGKWR